MAFSTMWTFRKTASCLCLISSLTSSVSLSKNTNRASVQLSGSHISNYYESHAYMQVHVLTTDWVKYRTNTKTSNVSWLTDIGRDGVHCICIANNCVTCITRAYLTLLGTGSCTRALTIGNFSSKNCFLGKIFKQIYLNAKKQTKILYSFLGFHLYISWIIIKSMFSP